MTRHQSAGKGAAGTARTLLFVPGTVPERFAKASATEADLVVLDLEDAVPDEHKLSARGAVAALLDGEKQAAVRLNAVASRHHHADVSALVGLAGLSAVVVPMADNSSDLYALHRQLGPDVEIIALIETALGLTRAVDIASTPGVTRLAFGHLDFAVDIDAEIGEEPMLLARSSLVIASRAAGLSGPVDGVTTALDDGAVAGAEARRSRRLGFTGKLCIHPRQVDPVNAAFTPSAEDVVWARRVLEGRGAGGAARVDGHMIDAPITLRAEAILTRAGQET